jgi:TatD DNase family protein
MQLIDTHAHLYLDQFEDDRTEMIARAKAAGVKKVLLPDIDSKTTQNLLDLVATDPEFFVPMFGLHPCSVNEHFAKELEHVERMLDKLPACAVGEIGIDLYWDKSTLKWQQEAFEIQIGWAKERGLPIVIHARDSYQEIFDVVDRLNDNDLTGVFHCFTGTSDQAAHIVSYGGFKMGIGGVVTFKNGGLDKTLANIDLQHLVLETDAPYLSPVPYRGKRNESAYIRFVVDKLAEIYDLPAVKIGEVTSANARRLFGL